MNKASIGKVRCGEWVRCGSGDFLQVGINRERDHPAAGQSHRTAMTPASRMSRDEWKLFVPTRRWVFLLKRSLKPLVIGVIATI
jgi:hypothetical protein